MGQQAMETSYVWEILIRYNEKIFTVRLVKHSNRLPKEVLVSILEDTKT